MTIVLIMFALCMLLIIIGAPISFSMGLSAVAALAIDGSVPLLVLPQRFYSSLDSFSLLAIPLYIFAGEIMNVGGVTQAMVRFARALVGHIRGGLGQVNILTSILFAGISGSAAADCAAVGSMMLPAMKREGYRPEWSVVITAASSILGPIIPPSILMVLYGSMTGLSIGALFLAGVLPGLIMAAVMMALVYLKADAIGAPRQPRAPLAEVGSSFIAALPALIMPALIIGGILSGVFTPTEAGIVAVGYGLLYGAFARRLSLRGTYRFALDTALSAASILIILGGAALFSWIIARAGLPAQIADWLAEATSNGHVVLFLIVVVLLVIGMFIETISALILVTPVLAPIAQSFGFDPIHFAVVTVIAVLIGSLTPPVAVLLLLTCKIGGVEYAKTMRPLAPFILVLALGLLAIMYLPAFTLWLPRVTLGYAG
ncbi:MAG: TRAP transporter large permease [Pikeienuella sp.]